MKHLLASLLLTPILLTANEPSYRVVEDASRYPILNPALAERKTSKIILDNDLEVYLISDPGSKQSAAGICVEAGSWDDPKEYPGMAHFLEHMLFMGNVAYPEEFEYMQYVNDHGGKVNASTWPDRTIYMFSINNDAYEGALDRFSHFFIDPLFLTSCIERELHAVDQEHAKNVEHDGWRQYMVFKETGNPLHPNASFSTGNAKTLGGIPQEALKTWYDGHYSSDKMHLILLSPLPLEKLIDLCTRTFSQVPRRGARAGNFPEFISSPHQRGHMIFLKPVKDLRTLTLMWEVPAKFTERERQPGDTVAYVLNSEAENSLAAQLKREKLAESLSTSCDSHAKDKLLFTMDIQLTPQGITQADTVITRVFQALARLKEKPMPSYLFDERKSMAILDYQYQSRDDAFSVISKHAHDILEEDLTSYPEKLEIPTQFDPQFISSFIRTLTPESCIYFLQVDPEKMGVQVGHKERWMGAEYAVKEIPQEKLALWAKITAHPQISLPSPNPFLPDVATIAPSLQKVDDASVTPELLVDDSHGKIYYAQDHRYLVPEVYSSFSLKTPLLDGSARANALGDLYIKALTEKLSSTISYAKRAGLHPAFDLGDLKFTLCLYGYQFKAPLLLKEIFGSLKTVHPSKEQFEIYRQTLLSAYENSSKELPVMQASELLNSILYNDSPISSEKLAALRSLSYEEFMSFCKTLFKNSFVEGLVYGNLPSPIVETLWSDLKTSLASTPFPLSEQKKKQLLLLPETRGPYLISQTTSRQGNGVVLVLEEGPFTFEKRAAQELLAKALQESFFDTLRTKQQTAYFAKSWALEKERQLLQFFAVQSSTHHPSELIARFELFLEDFVKRLPETLPNARFEEMRKMQIDTLAMPPENLYLMGKRLTQLAFEYDGDFSWINKKIDATQLLTHNKLFSFAREFLSRANLRRLAILMEGSLPRENDFHYENVSKEDICDLGVYISAY